MKKYLKNFTQEEQVSSNRYVDLGVVTHSPLPTDETIAQFKSEYSYLESKSDISKADVLALLNKVVRNLNHEELSKDLDQRM